MYLEPKFALICSRDVKNTNSLPLGIFISFPLVHCHNVSQDCSRVRVACITILMDMKLG